MGVLAANRQIFQRQHNDKCAARTEPDFRSHVQFCRSAIGQVAFLFSARRRRCRHDLPNAPCVYNISTKQFDFPSKSQPFSSSYLTNTFRTNLA